MESFQLSPNGWLKFWSAFYSPDRADALNQALSQDLAWTQQSITMFGRQIPQPRLTAFYGVEGVSYQYSGLTWHALPWAGPLADIANTVSDVAGVRFNSVLCNLYRDGQDSMGWHADDEPELGPNPTIASVSFGQTRRFDLRSIQDRNQPQLKLPLNSGSLLVMGGDLQHHWQHQIAKTKKVTHPRINLTFRLIQAR